MVLPVITLIGWDCHAGAVAAAAPDPDRPAVAAIDDIDALEEFA